MPLKLLPSVTNSRLDQLCFLTITCICQKAQSFHRTSINKDQGLNFVSQLPVHHTRWPNKVKNEMFTWWCNCTAFLLTSRHFLLEKNFPCPHASKTIVSDITRKNSTLIRIFSHTTSKCCDSTTMSFNNKQMSHSTIRHKYR